MRGFSFAIPLFFGVLLACGGSGDKGGGDVDPDACDSLCDHTPTVSDEEADCVTDSLGVQGDYNWYAVNSCVVLTAAFADGVATAAQCDSCYADAVVTAEHCVTADAACL